MIRFIRYNYNSGQLYGVQVGKHRFMSYVTRSKNPNRSKDVTLSYAQQRGENTYEIIYSKGITV